MGAMFWLALAVFCTASAGGGDDFRSLYDEFVVHFKNDDLDRAIPALEKALALRKRIAAGDDDIEVAEIQLDLARLYDRDDQDLKSRRLIEKNVALARRLHRAEPAADTATVLSDSLSSLTNFLVDEELWMLAEATMREALEVAETELGADDSLAWDRRFRLAKILLELGDRPGAQALRRQSLESVRRTHGHDSYEAMVSTYHLAAAYRPNDPEGREIIEACIALATPATDLEKLDFLAQIVDALHLTYRDLPATLDLQRLVLSRNIAAFGERSQKVANDRTKLAYILHDAGRYAESEALLVETLVLIEDLVGPNHFDVASVLNNLARSKKALGDYLGARRLYERSLAIRIELGGPDSADNAVVYNNLGALARIIGDYEAAFEHFGEAVRLDRMHFADVANTLSNLGLAYREAGRLDEAEAALQEALELHEKAYGADHVAMAIPLGNLADLAVARREFDEARALEESALELVRNAPAGNPTAIAGSLKMLAHISRKQGDLEAARSGHEEAIALSLEVLSPDHPTMANHYNMLGNILVELGELEAGHAQLSHAVAIEETTLGLLDGLSQREALAVLEGGRQALDDWLYYIPDEPEEAWGHVLAFKGAVSARAQQAHRVASSVPEIAELAGHQGQIRREMARLAWEREPDVDRVAALQKDQERTEREIAARSAEHRPTKPPTADEICAALAPDSALIDFYRTETDYYAFVTLSDDCEVHRLDLGDGAALDEAVQEWLETLRDPGELFKRTAKRGEAVTERLLDPLLEIADERSRWFVVPDGQLATMPFGALPAGDLFLLERHSVSYLDRAGDVLLSRAPAADGLLVIGDVAYSGERGVSRSEPVGLSRAVIPCNRDDYADLPGTADEADMLQKRWKKTRKGEVATRLGGELATEAEVARALPGKAVVHLATHGFFSGGDCHDKRSWDPMLLSGLVLAGANRPPDVYASDDGILTAAEVATLDLSDTDLVVLSACETGLGKVHPGEGVLGLRRGFAISGVRTLIMSLWSVSDEHTAALMDALYKKHLGKNGVSATEALHLAQLEMLERQRKTGDIMPFEWAAFVSSGDWRP